MSVPIRLLSPSHPYYNRMPNITKEYRQWLISFRKHLRKLKLMMAAKIDAKEVISIVTLKSKSAINDALAFKGKDKDLQTFANQVEEAVKRMKREPAYLATSNTPVIMMDTFQCSERICRK